MRDSRELVRIERRNRKQFETANARFERRYGGTTALCILIATGIHFAVFSMNPRLQVAGIETAGEEIFALTLPPEVRVPPPPGAVVRPARPRVADAPVAREITIAPTTFEANPVETLPAPPPVVTEKQENVPFYVPRDVEPRLLNGVEIASLLKQRYPRALCDAGIQGRVLLWIFVDESGGPASCRVHTTSGYTAFDEVATEVVSHMRFAPAMHMDKPVAVWIAQPVKFTTS
jgi:TonB family protein